MKVYLRMVNRIMEKMLKPKDIQEILGCGRQKLYKIISQPDFPAMKIGAEYLIPEEEFRRWIRINLGKEYKLY